MNATDFLATVVTAEQGYFELCIRNSSWHQEWYNYPDDLHKILESVEANKKHGDVYFSSYLFSTRESKKEFVLPSRTIQQDLDNADTSTLPLVPTILVATSPNRHQAYWVLSSESEQHEFLSKRLAYAIPNCDKSGWPLGRKVRFPGTFNYKYNTGPHPVEVVNVSGKKYNPDVLELLPDIDAPTLVSPDYEFISHPPSTYTMGPHELLESIKDHVSANVYAAYLSDVPASDRSTALYALMTQCFKAGLSREQVYWIALHSANNKFATLKFNQDRELAKDVLRSEHAVKSLSLNIRELINEMRKTTKLLISERRRAIFEIVLTAMKAEGEFIRTVDNRRYYTTSGRPIDIDPYNPDLAALLDIKYALNKTEVEHTYTVDSLIAYSGTLPETGVVSALSHYDINSNQLLIHSGRKAVYSVTNSAVEQVVNGSYGVLFPWDFIVEPFTPALDPNDYIDWGHLLFGDVPNCLNMQPEQVECILKVWLMFLLLRNAANSRPILAFFGQPGSSKTTLARKIYAFLYGKHMDVSGVTNSSNFDMATANLPFFALDNADTWERWLPDRLAQSAGKTDVLVRRLYSNNQMIRLKRQSLIAITAHDPKFGRADVADRMIIFSLQRFENLGIKFKDEAEIINNVLRNRNKLWGSVIQDAQRVLTQPIPKSTELQLRIQDFARLGEWISLALKCEDVFRQTIQTLRSSQQTFNLDEDHALVAALRRYVEKMPSSDFKSQDQIYKELISMLPDEEVHNFQHLFKSSSLLVKRMSNLQSTLNTIMHVEFQMTKLGERLWRIRVKDE